MQYAESILDLVGHTPLVRINRLTRGIGPLEEQPLVLAKLEMFNPGGSVKDRIGLPMIEAAERDGLLRPGGTIVEPTSGNTGHGLAIAAALRGYRCIFVMADKQSAEKQAILRAYGAEVVLCPTNVPPDPGELLLGRGATGPRHPRRLQAGPVLERGEPAGARATTGPEIWEQTAGRITHFVASVGTGGTITGAARYLRRSTRDPWSSGPTRRAASSRATCPRPYLTEGVGEDFVPGTLDPALIDRWVRVSDHDAFAMARRITREEGILAGESCGTAMVAALEVARELRRPARRRTRWSSCCSRTPAGTTSPSSTTTSGCGRTACSRRPAAWSPCATSSTTITTASSSPTSSSPGRPSPWAPRSAAPGVRDQPDARLRGPGGSAIDGLVGSVSETGLLARAYRDPWIVERTVGEVMAAPLPRSARTRNPGRGVRALEGGASAVLATRGERPAGIVTKLDILEYLGHRGSS